MSIPRRSASCGEHQGRDLARGEHRQRPARQQLEVPADGGAGEHREPVDDRVEQRAHAGVLAGGAGEEAVEVVAERDPEVDQRRRRRRGRRSESKASTQEDRDRRQAHVADQVRDRPRVKRRPARVCARQRARSGRCRTAARFERALRRRLSRARRAISAARRGRVGDREPLRRAPVARAPAPRPRPRRAPRLPTTIRSGQPSSSASVSFSPVPASRSS